MRDPADPADPAYDPAYDADYRQPAAGWNWLADLIWLAVLAAIAWVIYAWVT